jgi:Arc/MetJ-type ribon-helix-helix transcriptional regulator
MPKLTIEISPELARQIDRVLRDGWFASEETLVREAIQQFVESRSFLGDSPRMIHRFAADALNESKPETALKFADRAMSLLVVQKLPDLKLYQQLVELRVQVLLVLGRDSDALAQVEEAKERLPNNPAIDKWLQKLKKRAALQPA